MEDGLSISNGIIIGNTTHEVSVTVGNGPLICSAACVGIAVVPVPGA